MEQTPGIGIQSFAKVREENCFYVDKTDFIREWWESRDEVTLITRPRRFGKTLNLSMLECFFSLKYQGRADLFDGLSIWNLEEYRRLQGTFPVLFLSFAGVKADNYPEARLAIYRVISELYRQHEYLCRSEKLLDADKKQVMAVINFDGQIDDAFGKAALQKLCVCLEKHFGKKPLIFLDEYDSPMLEAYLHGYWKKMSILIQGMFNFTFKTNPSLERAVMTGITRISKESIFSDLNNLNVISTTSREYETCFGFTETEVFAALDQNHLGEQKAEVKHWYDGFIFGTAKDIYNPWSILNFISKRVLAAYWINTSSNALVDRLVREGEPDLKMDMESLLEGKSIFVRMDEQLAYDQLDGNKNAVWSLLVASGYLKVDSIRLIKEEGRNEYQLSLTNFEVQIMFRDMIEKWFKYGQTGYNDFLKALLMGNVKEMNRYMNRIALNSFSYFDTGHHPSGQAEPERFYHGFVLGLMVDLEDRYLIRSNRESGFGRYDVVLEPREGHRELNAIVLEFKVFDEYDEKTLEDTVREALRQIEEMRYDAELTARGFSKDRIRHYGFAFEGKRVLIG